MRADLARQLNASIYKAGQSRAGDDGEVELTFDCACGCMAEVRRSLRDYVIRGVIVPGHAHPSGRRPNAGSHVPALSEGSGSGAGSVARDHATGLDGRPGRPGSPTSPRHDVA